MSYHQERFIDESLLIYKDEKLISLFPAAQDPQDATHIVSHPGITYGGLLAPIKISAVSQIEIFANIIDHYHHRNFKKLTYKAVPDCFKSLPIQDDLYALFFHSASLTRRDLNCVIDLTKPSTLTSKDLSKMRNMLRKAEKNGVQIIEDKTYLQGFYHLLEQTLLEKYQQKPAHSFKELEYLLSSFPKNIRLITAVIKDQVIAGSLLLVDKNFIHTQYLANSEQGQPLFALDYVIDYAIQSAKENNKQSFSFGVSNEQQGRYLNEGLYLSKVKHGGMGMIHDFYTINL